MKNEIKVEFSNNNQLKDIIEDSYFADGTKGKLVGKKSSISIDKDDILYTIFKGMNNMIIKLTNDQIDGSARFLITEEADNIEISPVSIYCVIEHDKYSFY